MASASKYKLAMQERQEFLRQQRRLLEQQRSEYDGGVKELERLLERTRQEMVGYLLPELADEDLHALQLRLSYPGLIPIKREFDERLAEIHQRQAEMAEMDEIKNSEFLVSRVEDQMAEIAEAYTRFREELQPWFDSPWFLKLNERSYFSAEYKPSLLRRFWDWRAVSFLMVDLEHKGAPSFEDSDQLRTHYRKLRGQADPVIALNDDLVKQQRRLLDIKAEYESLQAAPGEQVAAMYRAMGEAILDHLQASAEQTRLELAGEDRYFSAFLVKESGIRKQIQYLRELAVTRIDSQVEALQQQDEKLSRKIDKVNQKLSRGKARFYTDQEVAQMRQFKEDKWVKRHTKLRRIRTRITSFDRYDEGSFLETYLWWDLITNRARADDIHEVRCFRQEHPDWDHRSCSDSLQQQARREDDAMDGAAAALAAEMVPGVDSGADDWQDIS